MTTALLIIIALLLLQANRALMQIARNQVAQARLAVNEARRQEQAGKKS